MLASPFRHRTLVVCYVATLGLARLPSTHTLAVYQLTGNQFHELHRLTLPGVVHEAWFLADGRVLIAAYDHVPTVTPVNAIFLLWTPDTGDLQTLPY